MKKIIICILIIVSMFQVASYAGVDVQLNGEIIDFTDENGNKVDAQIVNNRTMVPMRKIFEKLGAEIEWNSEERSVTAIKNNTIVTLQIDNKKAKREINGVVKEILLDSEPIIVDNRTLVPLRFIAESLDKQVGWDKSAYTAIIIDYDYFIQKIKQNNNTLYNMILLNTLKDKKININLTRNYYDLDDSDRNNSINVIANIIEKNNVSTSKQNVNISFSGNNNLIKEIIDEEWNNISYDVTYNENGVKYTSQSPVFSKILNIDKTGYGEESYKELQLDGNSFADTYDLVRLLANVNEDEININTFYEIEKSYNNMIETFEIIENETLDRRTIDINSNDLRLNTKYFDITRLDNIIFNNSISKIYNFINKKVFNYDVMSENLLYDTNNISLNINIIENMKDDNVVNKEMEIKYISSNQYNEKIEYIISISLK